MCRNLYSWTAIVVLLGISMQGCSSGPSVTDLSPEARENLSSMEVYRSTADLPQGSYEVITSIEGLSCKRNAYSSSSASEFEALSNLKIRAAKQNADAVANVTCQRKRGADWKNNCWSTVVCAGDAINITKPELAQTQQPEEQTKHEARTGTGWLASPGFVVTNYHVVEGHSKFTLVFGDSTMSANVVAQDRKNDLALLKPSNYSNLPPALPIANAPAETGSKVFTVGYPNPGLMGSNQKVTDGIISAQTGLQDDPRVYQTTVALQSGNSGGPLLNSRGEVVGITTSVLDAAKIFQLTGNLPQNVNYAIKAQYLDPLLSSVESPHRQIEPTEIGGKRSIKKLVGDVGKSVVVVISEK